MDMARVTFWIKQAMERAARQGVPDEIVRATIKKTYLADVYDDVSGTGNPRWFGAEMRFVDHTKRWEPYVTHDGAYEHATTSPLSRHFVWLTTMQHVAARKSPFYLLVRASRAADVMKLLREIENGGESPLTEDMMKLTPMQAMAAATLGMEVQSGASRLDRLVELQRAVDREMARLASRPAEPESEDEDGPVLFFRKSFSRSERSWMYTAIKVDNRWIVSGERNAGVRYTWDGLLDFIEKDEKEMPTIWLAVDWQAL